MDDCFEWLINDDKVLEKYCIRIFSFNTGKQFISKNRNKLLNKRIAFMIFKPSDNITQDKVYYFITETINSNYDINLNILGVDLDYHNYNLVVAGDGALWIRAMANWLGCNYILDKYHAFSYLWKSFVSVKGKKKESTDWTKYIDTSLFFADGNYNQLLNILKNNVNKQTYNYFKSNEFGIINQNKDWNIGCSAESDVFHLVKSLKGNGAKAYTYKRFVNMLTAKANLINSRI